jgi:hypothetical protein
MTALSSVESSGEVIQHAWQGQRLRRWLLFAGIGAVTVYAVGDLVSGLLYDGYSFQDQAISELSAYGSPVRPLALTWLTLHDLAGDRVRCGRVAVGRRQQGGASDRGQGDQLPNWLPSQGLTTPRRWPARVPV